MVNAEVTAPPAADTMPAVLIPTLDPDHRLCEIVDELHARGVEEIIVVDDGSSPECEPVFAELRKKPFCHLARHDVNRGKGAALRTAFMKYLAEHPHGIGCVTADDDGQHSVDDIINIAEKFRADPDSLLLGQRDFSGGDVPWKSRFGNVLTRAVFRMLAGIRIGDTQTGLRAIPAEVMEESLSIRGNRFEFETEMLLRAWDAGINFREIPIRTVYVDNNAATHFHPVRDAMRIYRVIFAHLFRQIFHFALTAMSSAAVDFLLFFLLTQMIFAGGRYWQIFLSALAARACSATMNFLLNRYWVFYAEPKHRSAFGFSAASYVMLCLVIFGTSTGLVMLASRWVPYQFLPYAKALIDTLLFFASYLCQKLLVFAPSGNKTALVREFLRRNVAVLAVLAPVAVTMALAVVVSNFASDGVCSVMGRFHWSMFGDGLLVLILLMAALCFRSRLLMAAASLSACLNLLIKIFALELYRETFMGLDLRDLKLLWQHTDGYAIRAVLGPYYALWLIPAVLAVLALIVGAVYLAWRKFRDIGDRALVGWRLITGALLALSILCVASFVCSENTGSSELYTGHLVRPLPVSAAYLIRDAFRGKRHSSVVPLNEKSRKILEDMEVIARRDEPAVPPAPRFDRIIIIALESLDLDFVRAADPRMPEGVTPNLDRLMAEYPSMTNFFCSSQPTSWGLTGILLSRLDFTQEHEAGIPHPSLFSIASKLGYYSCYFSPMTGVFAENRRIYGDIFSPDRLYFLEDWQRKYPITRRFAWGLSDREIYSYSLKEMRSWNNRRFVVLISTMDTHPPYTADGITAADRERFPSRFLRSLYMSDHHLGEFLKELMADKELYNDRTLVVITADHTATHGKNYLKRGDLSPGRVPLIFVTPDKTVFRKLDRNKYASSIDLTPTLVGFIGGAIPESFMGRDLFSKKNLAISWTHTRMMWVRSPGRNVIFSVDAAGADPEQQAFIDFFHSQH